MSFDTSTDTLLSSQQRTVDEDNDEDYEDEEKNDEDYEEEEGGAKGKRKNKLNMRMVSHFSYFTLHSQFPNQHF